MAKNIKRTELLTDVNNSVLKTGDGFNAKRTKLFNACRFL